MKRLSVLVIPIVCFGSFALAAIKINRTFGQQPRSSSQPRPRGPAEIGITLSKQGQKLKMTATTFNYPVSPRDLANDQVASKTNLGEIVITKTPDQASSSLIKAAASRERFPSVVFEFERTTAQGKEIYQTVRLTNATVSRVKTVHHGAHEIEEVSFTFQKIEYENKFGKKAAADDWRH